jgi:hypothetical protein
LKRISGNFDKKPDDKMYESELVLGAIKDKMATRVTTLYDAKSD